MASALTGSFYLTETVELAGASPDGTVVQGTVDLSSYVNVPTGQAIAIDQVDFITQTGALFSVDVARMLAANGALGFQLTDLNPGTLAVRADNNSLIASGSLNIDIANNIATHTADLYPDNFGTNAMSEMFMVVNDTLYLTGAVDGAAVAASSVFITARIRARVVKLSSKDWMAIAIQSTASDN
jgi:hypothetical protein